jgi:hypothetical protein
MYPIGPLSVVGLPPIHRVHAELALSAELGPSYVTRDRLRMALAVPLVRPVAGRKRTEQRRSRPAAQHPASWYLFTPPSPAEVNRDLAN